MKRCLILLAFLTILFQVTASAQDSNVVWVFRYDWRLFDALNFTITPDQQRMFVDAEGINIKIIDFNNGVIIDSIMGKGGLVGFSKDGKYIYTHTFSQIYKLDSKTYEVLATGPKPEFENGGFNHVSLMSDGRIAAAISAIKSESKSIFNIYDADSLKIEKSINATLGQYKEAAMVNFCISDDSKIMAAWQSWSTLVPNKYEDKLVIWDLENMKVLKSFDNLDLTSIRQMTFVPKSNKLMFNEHNGFNIINYQTGTYIKKLPKPIHGQYLSSDLQRLYLGGKEGINIYDMNDYHILCTTVPPPDIFKSVIGVTNDEKYVVLTDDGSGSVVKMKNCLSKLSVPDNETANNTILIPNPVKDILNIKMDNQINGAYNYNIVSNNGMILRTSTLEIVSGNGVVNVSELSSGSYFLNMDNGRKSLSFKFIVQR